MKIKKAICIAGLAMGTTAANAAVLYSSANGWTNDAGQAALGQYQLTISDVGTTLNWSLTVNPWNAEALGLFIDLGNKAIPNSFTSAGITNVSTSPTAGGSVTLFAQDITSRGCGQGCNINGLNYALANPDNQWELVFRFGTQGFNAIQTWNWTTPDFGVTDSDFGIAAIRSQQLCSGSNTLDDGDSGCGGSEKVWGRPSIITTSVPSGQVPEPGTLLLLGFGVAALGLSRRK